MFGESRVWRVVDSGLDFYNPWSISGQFFLTQFQQKYWVVVSNIFIFTSIWGRFPIWLIFFKGVETTNKNSRTRDLSGGFKVSWQTSHVVKPDKVGQRWTRRCFLISLGNYSWWKDDGKNSCTTWYVLYPIILEIGFYTSQLWCFWDFFHPRFRWISNGLADPTTKKLPQGTDFFTWKKN